MTRGGWRPGPLEGVLRRTLLVHPDARGSFAELWRAGWTDGLDPGVGGSGPDPARMRQANLSRSAAGVLRGLHCHRRQADLWIVVEGHPFVALVDVRPPLEGMGEPVAATLDLAPGEALYLPAGVAHGFYARDALTLVYLVSSEHDGSDELGFAWDDPAVGLDWPDRSPVLSGRDASAPRLAALLEALQPGE